MAQRMPNRSSPSNITVWKGKPKPSRNLLWSAAKEYVFTGWPSARVKKPSRASIRIPLSVTSGQAPRAAAMSPGDGNSVLEF